MNTMAGFVCLQCGECCKRYSITVLPDEALKISMSLKLPLKDFVEKHCQLFLEFFPIDCEKNALIVSSSKIPEKIAGSIKNIAEIDSYYLVLPMIALKKKDYCVFFDKSKMNCKIHSAKPKQCDLFPFISIKPNTDFKKQYYFCKGLQEMQDSFSEKPIGMEHYKEVSGYFERIKKNGFSSEWKFTPKTGIALLEGKILCNINEKDFFQAIEQFK